MLSMTARSSCESMNGWMDATSTVSFKAVSRNDGAPRSPSIFPHERSPSGRAAAGSILLRTPRSLPAGERPERLAGGEVLGPHGDELAVLDLLDQHLVLVLVGVALVVGKLDLAVQRVPASAVQRLPHLLAVAVRV